MTENIGQWDHMVGGGHIRSRLDRSVELHVNAFREDIVDSTRVNESEVM